MLYSHPIKIGCVTSRNGLKGLDECGEGGGGGVCLTDMRGWDRKAVGVGPLLHADALCILSAVYFIAAVEMSRRA